MKKLLATSAFVTVLTVSSFALAQSAAIGTATNAAATQGDQQNDGEKHHGWHNNGAKLSDSGKALMVQTMKDVKEKTEEISKDEKPIREELKTIVKADKFDSKAYEEKWKSLQKLQDKKSDLRTEAMVALLSKLDVKDRTAWAERFAGRNHKNGEHGGSNWGHGHHDGDSGGEDSSSH
jgi:Spy/CpxP family protein refolding chaperone